MVLIDKLVELRNVWQDLFLVLSRRPYQNVVGIKTIFKYLLVLCQVSDAREILPKISDVLVILRNLHLGHLVPVPLLIAMSMPVILGDSHGFNQRVQA